MAAVSADAGHVFSVFSRGSSLVLSKFAGKTTPAPATNQTQKRIQKCGGEPTWNGQALATPTLLQSASALDLRCECAKKSRESKYLFFTQRTTGSGLCSPNTLGIVSRLTSTRMQFAAKNTNNPATI
jgi:hypothetical protein